MSRAGVIGLALPGTLLIAVLIAVNLPVRFYAGDMLDGIDYTDLEGASLLSGSVWVNVEGIQGPMHLQYHWCPGLFPGRWCASLEHVSANLDTFLVLRGLNAISLEQTRIQTLDLQALGIAGGLVNARLSGEIDRLDWSPGNCPITGISNLTGFLMASEMGILGVATGSHRLDVNTVEGAIEMNLGGDTFSGNIEIRGTEYSAQGEMIAPESMLSMARSLMRPLGGNRFGWEIKGSLPC